MITCSEFKQRYKNINRPEDVDPAFSIDSMINLLMYESQSRYDDWPWVESLPPQFYEFAQNIIDDVLMDEVKGKSDLIVKIYERLNFAFQHPECFLPMDEDIDLEDEKIENKTNFYNSESLDLPKHILDILEVCGNHVVKPIGEGGNLFTYLHVESLVEEIQSIIDEGT